MFNEAYRIAAENGDSFDIELNIITYKGNERWMRLTGKGELKDGEFVRMFGTGQDITEQKILQQNLIESRNQYETLIQTVDGVVFESDAQTLEFKFVSEQIEGLLGYTPEECIQGPDFLNLLFHTDEKEDILKSTYEQIQKANNYTGDYRVIRKDGKQIWLKVAVSIIRENGIPKWLRGLMIDNTASKIISELEHLEKKVLELNADPTATTTHVLKTYLEGIELIFPAMQCSIMQVRNGYLYNWVSIDLPPDYEAAINYQPIANNTGSCGTAAYTNERVIVSDIENDLKWIKFKDIALRNNLRSCWSQPIRNASGEVIATLGMYYNTPKIPSDEEIKVIDRTVDILQVILQNRQNAQLLEEANLLMEQSQELAHFGSMEYDLSTHKLIWSKEFYNIFGIDKQVKPSLDFFYDAIHPEDRERVKRIFDNFLITKKDYVSEERIIWPNGEIRDLRNWGRVRTNEKGEVVKIMSVYLDITASKKIQEELLASESRLRSLVDSQTNYVIPIGFDFNYTYTNKKYLEDFGFISGQSLIGTNSTRSVLAHQLKKHEEVCLKCIAQPNEVFEIELEKYDKAGNIKYSFWHFICLTNSKGKPQEIQCIGIDISDRKHAENEREKKALELEESKKKYRDLFQLSPQPMWVHDPLTLQFLDINNAAITQYGYSRKEFLSMKVTDINIAEELSDLEKNLQKQREVDEFFQGIFIHKLKNGEQIKVDIKLNTITFNGKIAHVVLANNITEPLKYLEALEKQNARLAEIAWIQSHVVRAPLSRIMGLVDILQNYYSDPKEQRFILEGITTTAMELDLVIRDIVQKSEQFKLTQG